MSDFEDLVASLGDMEIPDDVIDVTTLSHVELLQRLATLNAILRGRDEYLFATTADGRALQSERDAVRLQLKKKFHAS